MVNEIIGQVKEIIERAPNVKSVRLDIKGEEAFSAGQWMFVTVQAAGQEIRKPLSISNSPTEKGYLEFTKKITGSDFSKAINNLKVKDPVKVKYPFGNFTYEDKYPKIAFLSGGIGITPVRSLTKYIVDKNLGTDAVLLYGNNRVQDIAFKEDFERMQHNYPKFKVVHVVCEKCVTWEGWTGFITGEIIRKEIADFLKRRFYLCGPPIMVDGLKKILLEELGVSKEMIVTENFAGY